MARVRGIVDGLPMWRNKHGYWTDDESQAQDYGSERAYSIVAGINRNNRFVSGTDRIEAEVVE